MYLPLAPLPPLLCEEDAEPCFNPAADGSEDARGQGYGWYRKRNGRGRAENVEGREGRSAEARNGQFTDWGGGGGWEKPDEVVLLLLYRRTSSRQGGREPKRSGSRGSSSSSSRGAHRNVPCSKRMAASPDARWGLGRQGWWHRAVQGRTGRTAWAWAWARGVGVEAGRKEGKEAARICEPRRRASMPLAPSALAPTGATHD